MAETQKSDLPFGSEFSPSQISLRQVLQFAHQNAGDWKAFENAVYEEYFKGNNTTDYNRRKLANNTKLGMIAYGLFDREQAKLTDFGNLLLKCANDKTLYETFARHILLNLHGMNFVQCILDMHAAGETVDLIALRERLEERGIHYPRGGKHPSMMRLWLQEGGVFDSGYRVNEAVLQKLTGTSSEEFNALAVLSKEQQTFLKTLANLPAGEYASNEIEKLSTATYGVKFNEKNLPKQVLYPLSEAGYISLTRGGM